MKIHFKKMFAEQDFVIFDGRENKLSLTVEQLKHIADRHSGVGCYQIGIMRHSEHWQEMTFLEVYDFSGRVKPSVNIIRCVADMLMSENFTDNVIVETSIGSINCWKLENGHIKAEWTSDTAPVHMTGPVTYVFDGKLTLTV
jgi:diaminopimelate epimerase